MSECGDIDGKMFPSCTPAIDDSASPANARPKLCRPRTRSRSRDRGASVTAPNGAADGGRKSSPILLRSHPSKSSIARPPRSRWRCIFGARIPFPVRGREPTASTPRKGSVLATAQARSCRRGLPPFPSNPRISLFLVFLVILPTPNTLLGSG